MINLAGFLEQVLSVIICHQTFWSGASLCIFTWGVLASPRVESIHNWRIRFYSDPANLTSKHTKAASLRRRNLKTQLYFYGQQRPYRHKKGVFITLFKPEEFDNAGFVFQCGQRTFRKRSFSHNYHLISPKKFFSNSNLK